MERFKGLDENKLQGASCYTDAMVDDSRLVLRVLQDSIDDGGYALNYTKVERSLINRWPGFWREHSRQRSLWINSLKCPGRY